MDASTHDAVPLLVSGTTVELPGGKLTCHHLDDLTVLSAEGACSTGLLRELEQRARRIAGALGLDFSALRGISAAIVPMLERLRISLAKRNSRLVLLDAPAQLRDILELHGLADRYFADAPERVPRATDAAARNVTEFSRVLRQTDTIDRCLEKAETRIKSFMPQTLPVFPNWRFAAYWRPCERIGGDFYDFIPLGDQRMGIAVGDVSGHGIAAAVIMGIAKKVLRLRARDMITSGPAEVVAQVNRDLRADLGRGTFVTALYGVLDIARNEFTFVRAGHEAPLRIVADGGPPEVLMTRGAAIGILPPETFDATLEERVIALGRGEGIVLLSDGACDCVDARGVHFGKQRVGEALTGTDASRAVRALLGRLSAFVGEAAQGDDLTVVAFARDHEPAGADQ